MGWCWGRRSVALGLLLTVGACTEDGIVPGPGAANTPPSAPVVAIAPANPTTADDLTVSFLAEATDADGDAVTYTYRWLKDSVVQADLTTAGGGRKSAGPRALTRRLEVAVRVAQL